MEKCLSCDGIFVFIGKKGEFDINKCELCGLGRTVGSKVDYRRYHRDETYIQEEEQFKNIFLKRLNFILSYKKGGKVLDIGSSTGLMLTLFRNLGWEVLGIEPSKNAFKNALKRGIPTLNSTFPTKSLKKDFFDVVIINHVLEHIKNPLEFLSQVDDVLKSNGIILIDVPNFGSLSAKIKSANWEYVLPKEHIWHFTSLSLTNILRKSGFKVICEETNSGIWDYGNPFQELVQSFLGLKKRFVKNLLTAIPTYFISKIGYGTGLTIIAQKQND